MDRIRRLQVTFMLACNNVPIIGYPLSILYIFRRMYTRNYKMKNTIDNAAICAQHRYVSVCARMFGDSPVEYTGILLYSTGFAHLVYTPVIRLSCQMWVHYPIGAHICAESLERDTNYSAYINKFLY